AKNELKDAIVFEYFDSYAFEILREKFQQLPKHANAGIFFELIFSEENLDNIFNIIDKMLRENNASPDEALGSYERQDIERIRDIRHALPATINETIANRKTKYPNIHKISVDIAVPEDKLLEMINYYKAVLDPLNFEYTIFGHIGEAHLHMNILPRNNEEFVRAKDLHLDFAHKAVELQGTVSGEHGIGKIKHNYLEVMYGREAIKQMIAVKKALDPNCILNRGNIFPEKLLYE
ncbi:MAG: FAD-linked oxidase C-terminal domain-containing protein, partial [Candidatus Thermoplasmatota archaeon]